MNIDTQPIKNLKRQVSKQLVNEIDSSLWKVLIWGIYTHLDHNESIHIGSPHQQIETQILEKYEREH